MANENPEKLTVPELRDALEERGVSTEGKKDDLVTRLEELNLETSTDFVPDVFVARFDPANPPAEDPGPVVEE